MLVLESDFEIYFTVLFCLGIIDTQELTVTSFLNTGELLHNLTCKQY